MLLKEHNNVPPLVTVHTLEFLWAWQSDRRQRLSLYELVQSFVEHHQYILVGS